MSLASAFVAFDWLFLNMALPDAIAKYRPVTWLRRRVK